MKKLTRAETSAIDAVDQAINAVDEGGLAAAGYWVGRAEGFLDDFTDAAANRGDVPGTRQKLSDALAGLREFDLPEARFNLVLAIGALHGAYSHLED